MSGRDLMAAILVIEDEFDLNNLLRTHLEAAGYGVYQAFDGAQGLALVAAQRPQLVLLDWMLPGMDGLAVCRQIRQEHLMPIIMLTARAEEIDRVLGLEVGADDYVVKPFSVREVLARVRAALRRVDLDSRATTVIGAGDAATSLPEAQALLVHGPLQVNQDNRIATLDGAPLDLTPKEFDVLALLVGHPGRAFSRDYLLEHLWGYDYDGFDRTVDTHIQRLRRKLGPLGEKIATVWGMGYRFAE